MTKEKTFLQPAKKPKASRLLKLFLRAALVILALLLIYFELREHLPTVIHILKHGNAAELEEYVRSQGSNSLLTLVLLQTIETVAIVLPALPVYLCAGIIYGAVKGTIICFITNFILCDILFIFGKRMKSIQAEFSAAGKTSRIEALLQKTTHPIRAVFLLWLLPILPGGVIPLLCAQTKLTLREFNKGMAAGSLLSMAFSVTCGSFMLGTDLRTVGALIAFCAVIFLVVVIFRKQIIEMLR